MCRDVVQLRHHASSLVEEGASGEYDAEFEERSRCVAWDSAQGAGCACSLASLARCSPVLALFVAVSCDVYVNCFFSAPVSAVTGTDGPPNLVRAVFVSVVSLSVRRFVMNSFAYAVGL